MLTIRVRKSYFSGKKIKDKMRKSHFESLGHIGATIRKTAQRSMPRRKKGASKPGNPPFAIVGYLRDYLTYAIEKNKIGVVIGPIAFEGSETPLILEGGGWTRGTRVRRVYVAARPYMKPAFEKHKDKIPFYWSNILHVG